MLQFRNRTPFAGSIFASPDPDGVDSVYAIVKGTFSLGDRVAVASEQVPVMPAAAHHGDPATSSIRVPSDVHLIKPGTDVVLVGSAWAPGGRPAWHADVSLSVGPARRTLRVSGDRVWQSGAAGGTIASVAPFERMPLVWERAFGGSDQTEKGPVLFAANPVGTGFRAPKGSRPLDGMPLPNIEDPAAPISSPRDTPAPAGFAPVAPNWTPRTSYAGTYDERWQKERAPFLPVDFDPRFFHMAPAGLSTTTWLQGGELVDARGVTPEGVLTFVLPNPRIHVAFVLDSGRETRWANLDTVLLEPDARRLVLVWRTMLACDKKLLRVREIVADAYAAA